ncbi:hypothetical protein BGZ97_008967, partial [Linnemannia gamsii]
LRILETTTALTIALEVRVRACPRSGAIARERHMRSAMRIRITTTTGMTWRMTWRMA